MQRGPEITDQLSGHGDDDLRTRLAPRRHAEVSAVESLLGSIRQGEDPCGLALATFAILPFMFASSIILSRRVRRAFRETRRTIGSVSADLEENISGVRVAQAFAREDLNIECFNELNRANRDANVSAQGITAAFAPTLDVLSTVGLAIVIGYGGYLALREPPLVTVGVIVRRHRG